MAYLTDRKEQLLMLDHMAGLDPAGCGLDSDMVESILDGARTFASGPWSEHDSTGDVEGARWTAQGVMMPRGFRQAYRSFVEAGWGALRVRKQFGGEELPFSLALAVHEVMSIGNFGLSGAVSLTSGAVEALSVHGTPDQQARYLPKLATGDWTGTMNLTEPQAGTDVGALRTMATPRADGTWSIKGSKIFISYGDHDMADNIVHLVLARTPSAPAGSRGISLFIVPKFRLDGQGAPAEANDVRVASIEHKLGFHASPTCVMVFGENDDCIGEMIGAEHAGLRAMFTMMNAARIAVGFGGVNLGEGATQKAVAYARDRIQGLRAGQPTAIIEYPDVRRMLLRMKALTQAARALLFHAAGCLDRAEAGSTGDAHRLELLTPLAKAFGSDVGVEVASLGIQVHGGMGYIEETGAARFWRDARIGPIYEGTNGVQAADLVGRKLTLDGGAAFAGLIDDMRATARHPLLRALVDQCETIGLRMMKADADDRLAGSSPFLRMLAVAVSGWLLESQLDRADDSVFWTSKQAAVGFFLDQIVPETQGLSASALAPAAILYALAAEEF